jgi:hypothetical protein
MSGLVKFEDLQNITGVVCRYNTKIEQHNAVE